ncbi:MAG: VWA domain-containing protein [Pirellulaceae bacterium]
MENRLTLIVVHGPILTSLPQSTHCLSATEVKKRLLLLAASVLFCQLDSGPLWTLPLLYLGDERPCFHGVREMNRRQPRRSEVQLVRDFFRNLAIEQLEDRRVMYSQAVHEWLTEQGYDFFTKQFGESALTPVPPYVDFFSVGAFDEDEVGRNPFGQSSFANHPSLRHFWAHDDNFNRVFDDGLFGFDSAANRAIKYFRGGYGLTDVFDSEWGDGPSQPGGVNAVPGQGAAAIYESSRTTAVYYLGHVAHLLEDMSVPAHIHADQHLDAVGVAWNPDPYHDWVDGQEFSTSVFQNPSHYAAFDDINPTRWTRWALGPDEDSRFIRKADEIQSGFSPGTSVVDVAPLYRLFLDVASFADDFDSRNANGELDQGTRGNTGGVFDNNYNNWTREELDAMASILVPRSIHDVADLIRYFYGVVDFGADKDPHVEITALDELELTNVSQQEGPDNPRISDSSSIELVTAASDQDHGDSGVGKDTFRFEYREKLADGSWTPWQEPSSTQLWPGYSADDGLNLNSGHFTAAEGASLGTSFTDTHGAKAQPLFRGQIGHTYGFRVTVEDGAGNTNEAADTERYVKIGRSGVNVVEVIDRSGSMSGTPLADAKQAAILFLNQMDQGDRIGVVSYSSSASTNYAITQIGANNIVIAQASSAINALSAGGNTSIGSGIAAADVQLDTLPAGEARAMIVLTDGVENTSPYAIDVINSQVAQDIRIYTIGFGTDVDGAALAQIAALRGGTYYFAPNGAALAQIYAELSGIVSGDQVQNTVSGTIQQNEIVSGDVSVDPTVSQLTFGVTWPGSDLDLELVRPDGVVITQAEPGVSWFEGPTYEIVKVDVPMLGDWQVRVKGVQVDAGGEPYQLFSRIDSSLRADLISASTPLNFGDAANVRVQISGSARTSGVEVLAKVREPGNAGYATAILYDDGVHNDGGAGDGIYGNDFLLGNATGQHEIVVEVSGAVYGSFPFSRTPTITREVVGATSGSGPQTIYPSANVPVSIASNSTQVSTLTIGDSLTISDLDVQLNITHTFDSDLDVFLVAPGGQRIELFTDVGSGGDNFNGTILDAEATTVITSGTAPFAGVYRPEGNLQLLSGLNSQGTWKLEVSDDASGDVGTLNSWSLLIRTPQNPSFSVIDNGTLLSLGQTFGLGILTQDEAPPVRTITVRNDGVLPVAVSGIQLPTGFRLVGSPKGVILVGDSASISLQTDTSLVGHHRGSSALDIGGQGAGIADFGFAVAGSVVPKGANPWKNFVDAVDVDADGGVTPVDALLVINQLNLAGSGPLVGNPPTFGKPRFLDVNGDRKLSPIDALYVINRINAPTSGGGEGERTFAIADIFTSSYPMVLGPLPDQLPLLQALEREFQVRVPRQDAPMLLPNERPWFENQESESLRAVQKRRVHSEALSQLAAQKWIPFTIELETVLEDVARSHPIQELE